MIGARSVLLLTSITLLAFGSVASADNDEMLARAKDLYRAAAYDEALAVLDEMANDPAADGGVEAREYRLFCLIALERKSEARSVIESLVNADPFYQLSTQRASPRVGSTFREVRQSLLPAIVQRTYADAKAAFDRQDPQSTAQFERVLSLLDDPDAAFSPSLSDLRTVVSAFRDLSKAVASGPVSSPVAPPVAPVDRGDSSPAPSAPIVVREGEPDVVAPVALNQTLPRWIMPPGSNGSRQDWGGALEVLIDENGDVISATLRESFHPSYDAQLIKAARSWKYRPALKGGMPVRFVKVVNVRFEGAN